MHKEKYTGIFICYFCHQNNPFEITKKELGKRVTVYCQLCGKPNIITVSKEHFSAVRENKEEKQP